MSPRKKGAISTFVQSGNLEISSLTGFKSGTMHVAVGWFPYLLYQISILKVFEKMLRQILRDVYNFASGIEQQSAISCEKS